MDSSTSRPTLRLHGPLSRALPPQRDREVTRAELTTRGLELAPVMQASGFKDPEDFPILGRLSFYTR